MSVYRTVCESLLSAAEEIIHEAQLRRMSPTPEPAKMRRNRRLYDAMEWLNRCGGALLKNGKRVITEKDPCARRTLVVVEGDGVVAKRWVDEEDFAFCDDPAFMLIDVIKELDARLAPPPFAT